jgi:NAD(P)-dependent dehydrogenase (short-subunit alcohol dehydrogenase family)
MNSENQKAIFITGSSSGLGRAAAKLFALKRWKVIATMRNPNTEKELTIIPGVTLMALNTTDPQQIQSVAEQVVASGGVDVEELNATEKRILNDTFESLVRESPDTPTAVIRFKKLAGKAGKGAADALRTLLVDILSEAVRKQIWPS